MPERQRVVKVLAEATLGRGIHWFYSEARPDGAQAALDEADRTYAAVIEEIDWVRVMWEAKGRCSRNKHIDEVDYDPFVDQYPCGPCVQAALLVNKSWER